MKMWTYTLRELSRRPARTLLTLAGIVIGVAAVTAVVLTTQATRRAAREMFESLSGRAALEVVGDGLGGFPPDVAVELGKVPGVRKAVPLIRLAAGLMGKSGLVPVLVLGVDPAQDGEVRDYALARGHLLDESPGVLLPLNTADSQHLDVGGSARLYTTSGIATVPIVGILEPRGAAAFNAGAVVFLPLGQAQKLFGLTNQINNVQLVLSDDADVARVEKAVTALLPAGLSVQAPAERGELMHETLYATEQGLATISLVSLVAGAFVILNTFLMSLGERQRQIAILRALGATRRQVTGLLLREAALLGVAGTLLGMAGGLLLAQGLRQVMMTIIDLKLPELQPSWEPFLIGLFLGPGMSFAATWLPARAAGRRPPLQGLAGKRASQPTSLPAWTRWLGSTLVGIMLLLEVGLIGRWFPQVWNGALLAPALALGMVGCVLCLPMILGPLSRLTALVLRAVLGVEGKLAFRQLERQPIRQALTVGVLFVGIAVSLGFGNSLLNNIRNLDDWYGHTIICDFLVRGNMPDTTFVLVAPMPEELGEKITAVEGIARVDKTSFVLGRARGRGEKAQRVVILARSFVAGQPMRLDVVDGNRTEVQRRLEEGEVVLGTVVAQRLGVTAGDEVVLETPKGPRSFRIAALATEYTAGGMAIYVEWRTGREVFAIPGVHTFEVTAMPGQVAVAAKALRDFCEQRGLVMQTNAELLGVIQNMVGGVQGFLYVLMALLFVVASLGVVNTLTMNVLEQTRDFGVLRAVGLRRAQARKMVLAQALLMAVVSLVPGLVVGLVLALLMNLATEPLIGQRVPFRLDFVYLGTCLTAALVVAVLAGWFPARQAAHLQVIEALHYE